MFLRHIIAYDDSDEHRELESRIAQVHRDQHCVGRCALAAALCAALALAGLAYGMILQRNFAHGETRHVFRILCDLGLASLICLVAFAGLLTVYRRRLNRLRRECRRLIAGLLKSRLGESHIATVRGSHPSGSSPNAPPSRRWGSSPSPRCFERPGAPDSNSIAGGYGRRANEVLAGLSLETDSVAGEVKPGLIAGLDRATKRKSQFMKHKPWAFDSLKDGFQRSLQ